MQKSWEPSWHRSKHSLAALRHAAWQKRRLHAKAIRRWRRDTPGWAWFASYADDLAFGRREMARALRTFLRAPDGFAACGALLMNPILLMESASEWLRRAIARAKAQGDQKGMQVLEDHLALLKLARKKGIIAVMRKLTQHD